MRPELSITAAQIKRHDEQDERLGKVISSLKQKKEAVKKTFKSSLVGGFSLPLMFLWDIPRDLGFRPTCLNKDMGFPSLKTFEELLGPETEWKWETGKPFPIVFIRGVDESHSPWRSYAIVGISLYFEQPVLSLQQFKMEIPDNKGNVIERLVQGAKGVDDITFRSIGNVINNYIVNIEQKNLIGLMSTFAHIGLYNMLEPVINNGVALPGWSSEDTQLHKPEILDSFSRLFPGANHSGSDFSI